MTQPARSRHALAAATQDECNLVIGGIARHCSTVVSGLVSVVAAVSRSARSALGGFGVAGSASNPTTRVPSRIAIETSSNRHPAGAAGFAAAGGG